MTKESKGSRLFGDRQIPCDRHRGCSVNNIVIVRPCLFNEWLNLEQLQCFKER